jgi:hypothetical protein
MVIPFFSQSLVKTPNNIHTGMPSVRKTHGVCMSVQLTKYIRFNTNEETDFKRIRKRNF